MKSTEFGTPTPQPETAPNDKIVHWEEFRKKADDLRWQQFSVAEKFFDAFINLPVKIGLFVRQAFGEAYEMVVKKIDKRAGHVFQDKLSGDLYIDRVIAEDEIKYTERHGLGKKFQAKAARLSRQAFDECRDFSVLKRIGQLRPTPL